MQDNGVRIGECVVAVDFADMTMHPRRAQSPAVRS
jgi:hypothetical protein